MAAAGELELELGPLGYVQTGPRHFLFALSASVLNVAAARPRFTRAE